MKLEEDFLIAEMCYNNFVVKNEVPTSWKFLPFFIILLSVQGQSNTELFWCAFTSSVFFCRVWS